MRNFRKAALAGATAVAVAFGSASVAIAEESTTATPTPTVATKPVEDSKGLGGSSTKLGHKLGAWKKDENGKVKAQGADGRIIFGIEKPGFREQPVWAQIGYFITVFTSVAAAVGLFVGPAYNFVVHGLPALNK